jgi:hypothetical protein
MISLVPKAWQMIKRNGAKLISKYLKGYLAYTKIKKLNHLKRMHNNFSYFDKIKHQLEEDAQRKIKYYWDIKKENLEKKKQELIKIRKKKNPHIKASRKIECRQLFVIHIYSY